jgi:ABC-2 type transport system ATP-binding protein
MALVHDPYIVVLDEAEAGLDPQSRILVREYIRSLARRKTVILTTHNMDEADRVADRVAIIDHGELLVVDTPDHLKQKLGGGDIIEIRLSDSGKNQEQIKQVLGVEVSQVTLEVETSWLRIKALDAVRKLPLILERLAQIGIHPEEMNVRANTLEDVFIQLTGRRLRE